MKLPRDLSGTELAEALTRIGYRVTRQSGSHVRLTTEVPSQHHMTHFRFTILRSLLPTSHLLFPIPDSPFTIHETGSRLIAHVFQVNRKA